MLSKSYYTREVLYLCTSTSGQFVTDDLELAVETSTQSGIPFKTIEYKTPEPYQEQETVTPMF